MLMRYTGVHFIPMPKYISVNFTTRKMLLQKLCKISLTQSCKGLIKMIYVSLRRYFQVADLKYGVNF